MPEVYNTDPNRIEYGLSKCFFAPLTKTTSATTGEVTYTYSEPVALVGIQAMTRNPEGESTSYYADDTPYFVATSNNGYSGELTFIKMTDQIRKVIFKDEESSNGLLVERADVMPAEGALIFECKGDTKRTRHVFYDVTFERSSEENKTKEDKVEPTTCKVPFTSVPIEYKGKQIVKAKCIEGSTSYDSFFESVVLPTAASANK